MEGAEVEDVKFFPPITSCEEHYWRYKKNIEIE
jgi:hypothetical protein